MYVLLGFDCLRLVVAKLCQKHFDSLALQILLQLSSLLRLFPPSVSLFPSHTFTPYSEFSFPIMTFAHRSNRYDDYEIMSFIMVISVFSVSMVILLILRALWL